MTAKPRWNMAVVVDRSRARFINRKPFNIFDTFVNELGRSKNRELTDDKPGLSRANGGGPSSTHSLGNEKDPSEDADRQFVLALCDRIEKLCYEKNPEQFLIVAEPGMKGLIRAKLNSKSLERSVWLDKDLAHFSEHELKEKLKDYEI